MRAVDQVRVTNAMAMAIEYLGKFAASSLAKHVVTELHAAIALMGQHLELEVRDMAQEDLVKLWRIVTTERNTRESRFVPTDGRE